MLGFICSWLSSALNIAVRGYPSPNRYVGDWLQQEIDMNRTTWPKHEMLEPSAVCMFFAEI